MAKQKFTVFQKLDNAITGKWNNNTTHSNSYDFSSNDGIVYKTDNEEDYLKTKKELQQNAYLNQRWIKANADLSVQAFAGLNNVKLMYRDADLMDAFPEIGMALDIMSEESCTVNSQNRVVSVYSSSDRIKSVLEELFVNRLDINVTAPMIIRGMCKYGNQFMLLNINNQNGITGWRQLPPYNVERLENGIVNPYGMGNLSSDVSEDDMKTKFVWLGENNSQTPFRNWQIGHFRLLTDSLYLPYGVSILQKARRHWRMLSLMEDMMLIYRLERSIERRVYKIYVGAIDDADVQAYVQEIANNFKRTPIIDPMTGQVDLRKNLLPVRRDTPIPLLDGRTITIEELAKEYEEGKENYVYSIQDKTLQVVPGKVVWCGKNYTAEKLIKITLDDDTYVVMAAEHEVVMRDGRKKRADELKKGESVMPFYIQCDKNSKNIFERYEKVYNPRSGKYERTHRLVAKHIKKSNDKFNIVHHIDFDNYNNNPYNLVWCGLNEYHTIHEDKRNGVTSDILNSLIVHHKPKIEIKNKKSWDEKSRAIRLQNMNIKFDEFIWDNIRKNVLEGSIINRKSMLSYINNELIEHLKEINKNKRLIKNNIISRKVLENRLKEHGFKTISDYITSIKKNHTIKSIRRISGDDVYCMTVVGLNGEDDRHNFAIRSFNKNKTWCENGIFVSNCVDQDIFIPVRDQNAPTPIDTLSAAQNLTAMDDIKFVQNKVFTALGVPKSFLNFEDAAGDGKNLALMDVRFTRKIIRIQQAFLMELTKIATIHLYLLGFHDELTNFSLSMNNPSTQAEQLEIENIQKKIGVIRDAVVDPGNGIPIMSTTRALKEIMKWSDNDIQSNLEEIRLEKALAAELEKTTQIIKKTKIFDNVDRIYGEPGAKYQEEQQPQQGNDGGMGGPSGGMGGPIGGGGDLGAEPPMDDGMGGEVDSLGDVGADENGEISGAEGEIPMENVRKKTNLLTEDGKLNTFIFNEKSKKENVFERAPIIDKTLLINEEFDKMIKSLNEIKE